MDFVTCTAIDLTESAYNLEYDDSEWLPMMLAAGLPILDQGLGVVGMVVDRRSGQVEMPEEDIYVAAGRRDFPQLHLEAVRASDPETLRALTRPGIAGTMSEMAAPYPGVVETYTKYVDYCEDMLGITAIDPDGVGIIIAAPLAEVTKLTGRARRRWRMLGAHISAAYRLRRALSGGAITTPTGLPLDAEAVLDPKTFRITDAAGAAKDSGAAETLREAAVHVDRARGPLRDDDPAQALKIWKALVRGRWSMVDWFDADGRRYVVALPNPPNVWDPRGLSEQECQIVTYAALGESNKMIEYRLGLSKARVSALLSSAMQKLGVRTRAQLVEMMPRLSGETDVARQGS